MNTHQVEDFAQRQIEDIEQQAVSTGECARDFALRVRSKSENFLGASREEFRKNPISFMAGALTFGFALGCIAMSGRHQASPQQRFIDRSREQANDIVSNASERLCHAATNLKFW